MFGPFKKKSPENEKKEETLNSKEGETMDTEIGSEQQAEHESGYTDNHIQCEEQVAGLKEQLVRVGADFQNFKKRAERERLAWTQEITADILLELLPVVDNFDRALEQARKDSNNQDLASWITGFELIHKSLNEVLKKNRIVPIVQVKTFDPSLHEALMQVQVEGYSSGDIVQVLERGFMFEDGKVLRPAKVSVAQ